MSETTPSVPGPTPARRARPAALGFIYAAVMMNTISMGVIAPVFPVLVKNLTGQGDAGAAQIMGVFGAVWALMQLIFAPIFGNLSDRYGRRPVLLVVLFGLAFDYLVMALAPNIGWLFIGRVISGITASSGSAAGAYVADISTPEDRARNFGRFQAAANAGILLGPALGGFVGAWDPRAPFWIAAALAFANGLYGCFIVPESLSHERRAPFRWRRANPIGAGALLLSSKGLLGMAGILFVAQFAGSSFNSIFQFYTHYRYGWGPPQIAFLLMGLGGGNIVIQSLVSGWAARRLGERGAVIAGMTLGVAGFAAIGLAPTAPLFWAGLIVVMFSSISFPNLSSLLSQRVGVDQQGQLQGALAILFGLAQLIGPIVFSNVFAWSIGAGKTLNAPGLSLMVGASLIALGVLLAVRYARPPAAPLASGAT
ncbi:MAG TPA: TCR/Tet family MFS transporter [Caulobacteraceae bacterium]|nr:TCR/Tet family MFS transporter [Caulobacteraceae bacterium]